MGFSIDYLEKHTRKRKIEVVGYITALKTPFDQCVNEDAEFQIALMDLPVTAT